MNLRHLGKINFNSIMYGNYFYLKHLSNMRSGSYNIYYSDSKLLIRHEFESKFYDESKLNEIDIVNSDCNHLGFYDQKTITLIKNRYKNRYFNTFKRVKGVSLMTTQMILDEDGDCVEDHFPNVIFGVAIFHNEECHYRVSSCDNSSLIELIEKIDEKSLTNNVMINNDITKRL
jgi:hypothetical protein